MAQLCLGQQAAFDQFGNTANAVNIFADPEQRMEIAQPALAFFQIGFDDIAAIAHPLMPRVAFGELFGDECARGTRNNLSVKPRRGLIIQRLITPDIARFKQRRTDRQIAFRHPHHFIKRAR